jgi:predicted glycoside hydrolase/deacetylase ChbG (UPF0249 family)
VALRIDRQLAQRDKLAQDTARSSDGFTSEFYGEAISEALFLHTGRLYPAGRIIAGGDVPPGVCG